MAKKVAAPRTRAAKPKTDDALAAAAKAAGAQAAGPATAVADIAPGGGDAELVGEWVPIDSLKAWSLNPREHRVQEVMSSVLRFGFGAPLLARRADRELIAGHGRYTVALELIKRGPQPGDKADVRRIILRRELPIRFMDLGPGESHALALADNQLGGEWNGTALAMAMRELKDDGVDLGGLGWGPADVEALLSLGGPGPENPELGENLADGLELKAKWTIQFPLGDETEKKVRDALAALGEHVTGLKIVKEDKGV